ncbi:MAG: hypothetical protein NWE93_12705 [Candidatus Bathyarchaeota archaeon]|nr:hypothetical protein [Candidatus Bathyarchaeota archaeon]
MRGKQIALVTMIIVGIALLFYSLYIGVMIGADWYGKDATFQWHMNNYIVMDAQYAYSIFGLATMAIGGLATGLAMAAFFNFTKTKKHILILLTLFFVAIATSGLGFNTLDFMLGCFYWTNMAYPAPIQVLLFSVDVWNFYFFFFVVPLWASGFLMGIATTYFAFVHRHRHAAAAYAAQGNLADTLKTQDYVVESKVFCRTRRSTEQTFTNTN